MKSYRVTFWADVEVSADDAEAAVEKARDVVGLGDLDREQIQLREVEEVDPLTGVAP